MTRNKKLHLIHYCIIQFVCFCFTIVDTVARTTSTWNECGREREYTRVTCYLLVSFDNELRTWKWKTKLSKSHPSKRHLFSIISKTVPKSFKLISRVRKTCHIVLGKNSNQAKILVFSVVHRFELACDESLSQIGDYDCEKETGNGVELSMYCYIYSSFAISEMNKTRVECVPALTQPPNSRANILFGNWINN